MDNKTNVDSDKKVEKMSPVVQNKLQNKGLNDIKKAVLKQLMGSYSGKFDFNKVRDEWKKNEKS